MPRERGFTLVELMIVVAVIGILSIVAYPSYTSYVLRSERSRAQQLMLEISNRQQQYIVDARAYTATIGSTGLNVPSKDGWSCAATCVSGKYTVSVALVAGPPPSFTITATPTAGTPQAADGVLTLTSDGAKTWAGNPGW